MWERYAITSLLYAMSSYVFLTPGLIPSLVLMCLPQSMASTENIYGFSLGCWFHLAVFPQSHHWTWYGHSWYQCTGQRSCCFKTKLTVNEIRIWPFPHQNLQSPASALASTMDTSQIFSPGCDFSLKSVPKWSLSIINLACLLSRSKVNC